MAKKKTQTHDISVNEFGFCLFNHSNNPLTNEINTHKKRKKMKSRK